MPAPAVSSGDPAGVVILVLLVAIAGLAVVANSIRVPYPILLVLGGLGLGFIPGMPEVELDPDLVLLIFLPPLLYAAAFFSNLHETRANLRPIGLLAVGLVVFTTAAVAVIARYAIGLDWDVAFLLGAIVSPTDAVAPAEIVRRLGAPRRVVTIIEGENLTNDWTALVTYKIAVAAVASGTFSLWDAGPEFLLTGIGGIAVGIAAGVAIAAVRRRVGDPTTDITISLLTAYAAYIPAEEIGVSGVMAAVTVGVWLGWQASELTTHETRLQLFAIWDILQFLLNAFLFVLIGLQLPLVLDELGGRDVAQLAGYAALVITAVIAVRIVWVFVATVINDRLSRRVTAAATRPDWGQVAVIAWAGMRGSVALAAALAIPLETDSGAPFPERDLILFLAFAVILGTLVIQGLTMPALIRATGVRDDGRDRDEELSARLETAFAGAARIDELSAEAWVHEGTAERVRSLYEYRQRRFSSRMDGENEYEQRAADYRRFMAEVIAAERAKLRELRDAGTISDEVRRRVERDLDLEQARLSEPD